MTIFSPRASAMAPPCRRRGGQSRPGRARCNDLIARVRRPLSRDLRRRLHAAAKARRPTSPGSIAELRALRRPSSASSAATSIPIPAAAISQHPPLTDRFWFPFYEKMVRAGRAGDDPRLGQLQPGAARDRRLLHRRRHDRLHAADPGRSVRAISRPCASSSRMAAAPCPIIGAATAAWPTCSSSRASTSHLMNNVFFDTCVYHQPGIDLLAEVIDTKNILFGIGDGRRGARHRPADRPLFRRHQALCRRAGDRRRRRSTRSSRAMRAASSRGSTPS